MTTETARPSPSSDQLARRLVRWTWGILGALLVQNVLGMGLDLYVSLPSSLPFTKLFVTAPLLTAHVVLAFLLVVATAAFAVSARRSRIDGLTWRAVLAFLAVLVALQEGFAYTFTLNPGYSFGMDLAFLFAVAFEVGILFLLAGERGRASRSAGPSVPGAPSSP